MSAPDVSMPNNPNPSTLSSVVSATPQMPVLRESDADQDPGPSGGGTRLQNILTAIAQVGNSALAGIPDKGRPSFATGLGNGARAEQQTQANEQAIKFQSFQDSLRAANLHNQDLQKQQASDDQQKAQQAAEDFQKEAFETNGGTLNTHPNDGTAVMQTLQAQTAANGAASIAPGTHVSADGKTINVPSDDPESLAAQVKGYKSLQGVVPGLPTLPAFDPSSVNSMQDVTNARNDLGKHIDIMQHVLQGYDVSGNPLSHDALKNLIPAYQAQIDALTKSGKATPYQLGTLKNTLSILQANESAHSDAEDDAADRATQQAAAKAKAIADATLAVKENLQDNAAADRPQKATKPQSTDWVPGVTADERKKAELAENLVFNANNVASILNRRPDIVGKVAGRITNYQQAIGSDDPDIVALAQDIHNIGMANGGLHGMRSPQQAEDYANTVLNHFKNGTSGIYGGLKSSVGSVQTFIDAARPETYKTHSKMGGAVRAMVPAQ